MSTGRLKREMARMVRSGKKGRDLPVSASARGTLGKFHNRKTECRQKHTHDSMKEAARCDELTVLEKGGAIEELKQQPRYPIIVEEMRICTYIADFSYHDNGKLIVEDVKGHITAYYKLKRKLMKACYGIDILET